MKTEFNIVFKDYNFYDWHFKLFTTEPKTDEEIEDMIMDFADMCNATRDEYSPVDIMDKLVDYMVSTGRDWYWTDMDCNNIEIRGW